MKSGGYIGQAWLVLALSLVFGVALAAVQVAWAPRIAENIRNETYREVPGLVLGPDNPAAAKVQVGEDEIDGQKVYRATVDGKLVGWVIPAGGQGFQDRVDVLIGLTPDATKITGLYVLQQKETPGLGAKIVGDWRLQFTGKPAGRPLKVVKGSPTEPNEIQAVTGATISSDSVAGIVNKAVEGLRGPLAAAAGKE